MQEVANEDSGNRLGLKFGHCLAFCWRRKEIHQASKRDERSFETALLMPLVPGAITVFLCDVTAEAEMLHCMWPPASG